MRQVFLLALLLLGAPIPLAAQDGFALKAGYLFNRTEVATGTRPDARGYGLGVEYVPSNIGFALSGFAAGRPGDYGNDATPVVVLAEVNYFLRFPFGLSPYAGVHSSLGTYTTEFFHDPHLPRLHDKSPGSFGYQLGVRASVLGLFRLGAEWRRLSDSAIKQQHPSLTDTQVLLGIALF